MVAQREPHAVGELVFGQQDEIVQVLLEMPNVQVERDPRGDALGKGVGRVAHDALRALPRPEDGVGVHRADADDAGLASRARFGR